MERTRGLSRWMRTLTQASAASALVLLGLVSFSSVAGANAANPDATTSAAETVNSNGTVTVNMSGTWTWASQATCTGRYGEGWAVDWWGISTSTTPTNNFTLTSASIVSTPGTTTTGSISSTGSLPITGGNHFHVSSDLNGEVVNAVSGCTVTAGGIVGAWSSSATYPSQADIPPAICVNMYDLHFQGNGPNPNDFSSTGNGDNSIQTNNFNPAVGAGYCATPHVASPAPTTTATKASSSSVTIGSAGSVTDSVTVTGSAALGLPHGTVAFYVCGPTTANALCTSTSTPAGTATLPASTDTGFVATGTSSAFSPTTAGTYCFAAVFTPASGSVYGA